MVAHYGGRVAMCYSGSSGGAHGGWVLAILRWWSMAHTVVG